MAEDRRTKTQILEELADVKARLEESESRKNVTVDAPAPVPEALAIAGCVRALDRLVESHRNSITHGYSPAYAFAGDRQQSDVERVLRLLAARYTVPLIDVQSEPCHRAHVDEIDPASVMAALGGIR